MEKEQYFDKKCELSEWELEEIELTIQHAVKMRKLIKLTLWDHNKLHDEIGKITGTDLFRKELLLDADLSTKRINFDQIQKASLVDTDD